MKHLFFLLTILFASLSAFAQNPCAGLTTTIGANNTAVTFSTTNITGGVTGQFLVQSLNVPFPCYVSSIGGAEVFVGLADTSSSNLYNIALYYNCGGAPTACNQSTGTIGQLIATTGQFTGAARFASTGGVFIPWSTTAGPFCTTFPCLIPAGNYIAAYWTSCTASCAEIAGSVTNNQSMWVLQFSTGYSSGFPTSLPSAPLTPSTTPAYCGATTTASHPCPAVTIY